MFLLHSERTISNIKTILMKIDIVEYQPAHKEIFVSMTKNGSKSISGLSHAMNVCLKIRQRNISQPEDRSLLQLTKTTKMLLSEYAHLFFIRKTTHGKCQSSLSVKNIVVTESQKFLWTIRYLTPRKREQINCTWIQASVSRRRFVYIKERGFKKSP